MAIEKSVLVEASPETVDAYLSDPRHLPEIWPSIVEVSV